MVCPFPLPPPLDIFPLLSSFGMIPKLRQRRLSDRNKHPNANPQTQSYLALHCTEVKVNSPAPTNSLIVERNMRSIFQISPSCYDYIHAGRFFLCGDDVYSRSQIIRSSYIPSKHFPFATAIITKNDALAQYLPEDGITTKDRRLLLLFTLPVFRGRSCSQIKPEVPYLDTPTLIPVFWRNFYLPEPKSCRITGSSYTDYSAD